MSDEETVHQYSEMTLRSRKYKESNRCKALFSRAVKQGLPALGRENNERHCFGLEKNAFPVVLVSIKSVHQLRSRRERKMKMAGVK